jgi:hypothetical protein
MTYSDSSLCVAPERGHNVVQVDGAELRVSTGGRQRLRITLAVGVTATRPQRRRVRGAWPKQKADEGRNPNSREEVAVEAGVQGLDGLDLLLEGIKNIVALARGDWLRLARFGELFTLAVGNGAQTACLNNRGPGVLTIFLDPDRGSGDTDGGDGEDGCEEVCGEQHRC